MKKELKPGMKIKFVGTGTIEREVTFQVSTADYGHVIKMHTPDSVMILYNGTLGIIHRRQVTHRIVPKAKPERERIERLEKKFISANDEVYRLVELKDGETICPKDSVVVSIQNYNEMIEQLNKRSAP